MATTVYEGVELTLLDDSKITARPLKISLFREFMKKFEELATVADDNDKSTTVLMECVQIAMKQYSPEKAKDMAVLEDVLDLPTVYKIVELASGVKLNDAASLLNAVSAVNN